VAKVIGYENVTIIYCFREYRRQKWIDLRQTNAGISAAHYYTHVVKYISSDEILRNICL